MLLNSQQCLLNLQHVYFSIQIYILDLGWFPSSEQQLQVGQRLLAGHKMQIASSTSGEKAGGDEDYALNFASYCAWPGRCSKCQCAKSQPREPERKGVGISLSASSSYAHVPLKQITLKQDIWERGFISYDQKYWPSCLIQICLKTTTQPKVYKPLPPKASPISGTQHHFWWQ